MDSTFFNDRFALAVGSGFYAAGLCYGSWSLLFRRRHSRFAAYSLMALGWLVQTLGLLLRSHATHSCPIGNTFEVLQFVSWSGTLLYLFVGTVFRTSLFGFFSAAMAVLLALLAFAIPGLDGAVRVRPFGADPIVALHAALALFSYGVFALLALTSLMYLIRHRDLRRKRLDGAFSLLPSIVELDHINLRLLTVGVTLLTVALAIALVHWHAHLDLVVPGKLALTTLVWLCYATALVQRLRQRCVAQRFAWIGLLLFLVPLFSLWVVVPAQRFAAPGTHTPATEKPTP
jgi:ABC-type uncharacterized transport system permease subunit